MWFDEDALCVLPSVQLFCRGPSECPLYARPDSVKLFVWTQFPSDLGAHTVHR
jgi:hypothetical protein